MGEFDLLSSISSVGFPIAVASFVLLKLDKTMANVNTSLQTLIERIDKK